MKEAMQFISDRELDRILMLNNKEIKLESYTYKVLCKKYIDNRNIKLKDILEFLE